MIFDVKGKVAIVTGGASGIGLSIAKSLLKNGVKGVIIADINDELGEKTTCDLISNHGSSRVKFVKTNVSDFNSFENAFKEAIKHFEHIDILFNNAGFFNENSWERCVDVNLKGVIIGTLLAIEKYLRNHKNGDEALIVNTSSIAAISDMPFAPIYASTKSGVFTITKSYGHPYHFNMSKVRTIAICPGKTDTPMTKNSLLDVRPDCRKIQDIINSYPNQSPEFLAKETMKLVERAPTGSVWIIEDSKPAYEFILPEKSTFEENTLKNKFK